MMPSFMLLTSNLFRQKVKLHLKLATSGYNKNLTFILFYLFIYFWLCWIFVSVRGLPLVVASRGHSSSRCAGLSLSRPLLLRRTGSRRAGSVIVSLAFLYSNFTGNLQPELKYKKKKKIQIVTC